MHCSQHKLVRVFPSDIHRILSPSVSQLFPVFRRSLHPSKGQLVVHVCVFCCCCCFGLFCIVFVFCFVYTETSQVEMSGLSLPLQTGNLSLMMLPKIKCYFPYSVLCIQFTFLPSLQLHILLWSIFNEALHRDRRFLSVCITYYSAPESKILKVRKLSRKKIQRSFWFISHL